MWEKSANACIIYLSVSNIINYAAENFYMIVGTKSMKIMFYCSTVFVANYCKVLLTHLEE